MDINVCKILSQLVEFIMPKQILTLNDFSGGINSVKNPRDIKLNELAVAQNIMVDEQGAIRTPGGMLSIISPTNISPHAATLVGGYGLEILESDYETEPITITGISNIDLGVLGYIAMWDSITSFADLGGTPNKVRVTTSANHGMSEDDPVAINSTTNYEGEYTATNIAANTFDIEHPWDGDDATGSWLLRCGILFPPGSEIMITGSTNNDGFYVIRETNDTDAQATKTVATAIASFTAETDISCTIKRLPKEETLVLLSDADNNKIDTYSKNQNAWTNNQIDLVDTGTLDNSGKIVYYSIDGAIRASDAEFGNGSKVSWFGYIKRTHFEMTKDANSAQDDYFDFFEKDNKLSPPTYGVIYDTAFYPPANSGFNITVTHTANDNSDWENTAYEIAFSFIYDGNQESLLYIPSETFTPDKGDSVTVIVRAQTDATGYNPRISGGRVYARKNGSDDAWFLLTDIDMRRGGRATLDGDFSAWTTVSTTTTSTGSIESLSPNLDTYESLNGYSHDVATNSIGKDGEQWKFGLVANRRAFIFNVRKYDEATGQNVTFGDRIHYSLPNKFDTFLPDNYITPVRGDAENYVCGIEFADRILAFKQNSVQIINISSPDPTGWSLESKHKYMGIRNPSAVTRTEFGVSWVNDSGCYFYNGSKIVNLIGDDINKIPSKIDDDEWATFIGITSTHQSIVGYERHKKQLIIMKDCTGNQSDGGDAYLYDFKTASWVKLINAFTDSVVYSNFQHDWNGDLIICRENGSNVDFYKWDSDDTTTNKSDIQFDLKDIDFGDSGSYTYVYKIIITYKTTVAQTNDANGVIAYSIDGLDNWIVFDQIAVDGLTPDDTLDIATSWQIAVIDHSTGTPLKVQSLQLRFDLPTATYFNLNDINIEYRNLKNARVQ